MPSVVRTHVRAGRIVHRHYRWSSPQTRESVDDSRRIEVFDETGERLGTLWLIDNVIADVNVSPRTRRAGMGRALVEQAEKIARSEGRDRVSLFDVQPRAREFWRRMGYRPTKHRLDARDLSPWLSSAAHPQAWEKHL